MSLLVHQRWLDVCCLFQPHVHSVKHLFSLSGRACEERRTRICAKSFRTLV